MVSRNFVKPRGAGCVLTVDVIPNARKSEIAGANRWRPALVIRLAAQPKDGAANRELMRFLAETLAIREDQIRVVIGNKSRHKVLHIDLPLEKMSELLGRE